MSSKLGALAHSLGEYLNPSDEVSDPRFKQELSRLSVTGVRLVAGISVGANLLAYLLLGSKFLNGTPTSIILSDLVAFTLFALAFALSYQPKIRPYARGAGLLLLFVVTVQQFVTGHHSLDNPIDIGPFAPSMVAITMLLAVACFPIRPLQALAMAFGFVAVFFGELYGRVRFIDLSLSDAVGVTIMVIVGLMSTALTAVVYRRRAEAFRARMLAEESLEALQESQARLLVSENAASQNRLAAALCHELNTPLGALSSALDTMRAASRKLATDDTNGKITESVEAASRSGRESLKRLEQTVARMKHLTNLDRAAEQSVDLNELWKATVGLLDESLSEKTTLQLDLNPLPALICQPQKLAAVFSNLLQNAADASDGSGAVTVATYLRNGEVVMEVRDEGTGIAPDKLEHIFEPDFRKGHGRISTSNWGLFVSRGIITEHGGHLEIESRLGEGTIARISLPTTEP